MADGSLTGFFIIHNDLLQCAAQGDLHCHGIGILCADQLRDRSVDVPQNALLGILHNGPYRFMIPFIVLFHSLKYVDFGKDRI